MRLLKSDAAATLREPKDFLVTVAKRVMVDLFRRRTLERAYLEMLALILTAMPRRRSSARACWKACSRSTPCSTALGRR